MKRITTITLLLLTTILSYFGANAQENDLSQEALPKKERNEVIKIITKDYSNWGRCLIEGKMKYNRLPVNISLKAYLERDKLMMFSFRAPFIGEAIRIEVTPDTLLAVNRMKRCYTKEAFANTNLFNGKETAKDLFSQLQSLLLGRVVISGQGELSTKMSGKIDIYPQADGGWMLLPLERYQPSWGSYGYLISPDGKMKSILLTTDGEHLMLSADYTYPKNNRATIQFIVNLNNKIEEITFDLESPKFGAKPFDRFKDFSKYSEVGIRDFVKSF